MRSRGRHVTRAGDANVTEPRITDFSDARELPRTTCLCPSRFARTSLCVFVCASNEFPPAWFGAAERVITQLRAIIPRRSAHEAVAARVFFSSADGTFPCADGEEEKEEEEEILSDRLAILPVLSFSRCDSRSSQRLLGLPMISFNERFDRLLSFSPPLLPRQSKVRLR